MRTWSGITPQVVAIQLDAVEGIEEHVPVMLAVADTLERCEPKPAACVVPSGTTNKSPAPGAGGA